MTTEILLCAFCGKGVKEVCTMIKSVTPGVNICDECVSLCRDIIDNPDAHTELRVPATTETT